MNAKNKVVFVIAAAVIAILSGTLIGVVSTRKDMPVKQETTIAPEASTPAQQETHEFYTNEEGETITFPVPDGTLPTTTAPASQQETTTKKGFNLFGKNETTTSATSATKAAAGTTVKTTSAPQPSSVTQASTAKTTTGKANEYEYAYAGLNPQYAEITDSNWNLMLVNRDYILPEGYEVKLAPSIEGDSASCKLDYRVAPHYNEMYLAAKADGIILTPVSGYRSETRQRNNLNNKINYFINQGFDKVTATLKAVERILPPGTSEHNAGMAMDIITADSTAGFQYTKEYKWLDEHAADYGFILRYPEDKVNITKIIYEPWHWRYVGAAAAKEIKASGQTLEEYLGKA